MILKWLCDEEGQKACNALKGTTIVPDHDGRLTAVYEAPNEEYADMIWTWLFNAFCINAWIW